MTFRVVSGVKLEKFNGVVGKAVHIYPVLQHDDDPGRKKMCWIISNRVDAATYAQSADRKLTYHASYGQPGQVW